MEEAIRLRDEHGGEVTVITVGPERAEQALRTAMAMGADKGIIVEDEDLESADEYSIARVLAAVIEDLEYDIILGGYMAVDDGSAQVGPRLAELLGIPHISTITKLTVESGRRWKWRRMWKGTQRIFSPNSRFWLRHNKD